jgi:hypothetical protein
MGDAIIAMNKVEKIEKFVRRTLKCCLYEYGKLASQRGRADGTLKQLYAVSVYCTIMDLAGDILSLIKKRRRTSSAILLRSLLESYVAFVNIINDEEYLKYMYTSSLESQRKMLQKSFSSNSEMFRKFHEQPEICQKRLEELTALKEYLKAEGYKPLEISERFKRAGFEAYYSGIYPILCSESHHDMLAIEDRHLNIQEQDKLCEVEFSQSLDTEGVLRNIYLLTDIILNSSIQIHNIFESSQLDTLKNLKEEYEKLPRL